MPQVHITDDLHTKASEFKQVIEALLEEPIDLDACIEIVLNQRIDSMLRDLIGSVGQETLMKSFQQLGAAYPKEVYSYVALTLIRGKEVQEREKLKRQIGFQRRK